MNIQTPRQLLAAIPHLVGFHPDNSLIMVAFDDDEISSVVRLDFPEPPETFEFPIILKRVISTLDNPHLVVVAYLDRPGDEIDNSVKSVTQAINGYCDQHRLPILDLLHVTANTWRSLMCDDESCCPPLGHELSNSTPATEVNFVVAGSSPFASRETLAARLSHRNLGDKQEDFNTQFEEIKMRVTEDLEPLETINVSELVDVIFLELSKSNHTNFKHVARCAVGLQNIRVRDGLLRQIYDHPEIRSSVRANLIDIVSLVPAAYIAACATVLAGCAWLDGNGALARIATDTALEADSTYSLARLLDTALSHGIPPRVWSESLAAVSYEDCLAGAA